MELTTNIEKPSILIQMARTLCAAPSAFKDCHPLSVQFLASHKADAADSSAGEQAHCRPEADPQRR